MKRAIIAFYQAYPPVSGAAAVTFDLARFLPGERLLVQFGRCSQRNEVAGVSVATIASSAQGRFGKIIDLRARIAAIVDEVARYGADAVILEGASWALYHLALLRALRKALPHALLIYHSHNVEYLLRARRNGRAIAALTRWAEGRLLRGADLSTAVSAPEQACFARLYGVKPILLPNGVDADRFAGVPADHVARMRKTYRLDRHTLLFSGFYAYPPNREAIDFLVGAVMPALRERVPSAALALSGGGAPYHAPWIRNAGSVPYEDFPAFVAGCAVAVAPIFSGAGTRLKILEAMAAGVPVVATEKAAEGLGLRPHQHYLPAGDAREFADTIAAVSGDTALAASLREAGRRKVNAEFSWKAIALGFDQVIGRIGRRAEPQLAASSEAVTASGR